MLSTIFSRGRNLYDLGLTSAHKIDLRGTGVCP